MALCEWSFGAKLINLKHGVRGGMSGANISLNATTCISLKTKTNTTISAIFSFCGKDMGSPNFSLGWITHICTTMKYQKEGSR